MFEMGNRFNFNTPLEIVNRRYEMIQQRIKDNTSVEKILEKYDVSRPIFYKFFKRYNEYGKLGLHNISRAPLNHGRKTSPEKEYCLMSMYQKYPYFSSYELNELVPIPAKTIQKIFKREGLKKVYLPKPQKKTILERLKREIQRKTRQKYYQKL